LKIFDRGNHVVHNATPGNPAQDDAILASAINLKVDSTCDLDLQSQRCARCAAMSNQISVLHSAMSMVRQSAISAMCAVQRLVRLLRGPANGARRPGTIHAEVCWGECTGRPAGVEMSQRDRSSAMYFFRRASRLVIGWNGDTTGPSQPLWGNPCAHV